MRTGEHVIYQGTRWLILSELDDDTIYIINNERTLCVDKSECQIVN